MVRSPGPTARSPRWILSSSLETRHAELAALLREYGAAQQDTARGVERDSVGDVRAQPEPRVALAAHAERGVEGARGREPDDGRGLPASADDPADDHDVVPVVDGHGIPLVLLLAVEREPRERVAADAERI